MAATAVRHSMATPILNGYTDSLAVSGRRGVGRGTASVGTASIRTAGSRMPSGGSVEGAGIFTRVQGSARDGSCGALLVRRPPSAESKTSASTQGLSSSASPIFGHLRRLSGRRPMAGDSSLRRLSSPLYRDPRSVCPASNRGCHCTTTWRPANIPPPMPYNMAVPGIPKRQSATTIPTTIAVVRAPKHRDRRSSSSERLAVSGIAMERMGNTLGTVKY
jgi:hypothetical protein